MLKTIHLRNLIGLLIISVLLLPPLLPTLSLPTTNKIVMEVHPNGTVLMNAIFTNVTKVNKTIPLEEFKSTFYMSTKGNLTYTSTELKLTMNPSVLIVIPFLSGIRNLTLLSTSVEEKGRLVFALDAPNFAVLDVKGSYDKNEAFLEVKGEVWYNPLLNITKAKATKFFKEFPSKAANVKESVEKLTNGSVKVVELKLLSYSIGRRYFKFHIRCRLKGALKELSTRLSEKYSNLPKGFYDEVKELSKKTGVKTLSSYTKLTFDAYEGILTLKGEAKAFNLASFVNGLLPIYGKYLKYMAPSMKDEEINATRYFLNTVNMDVSNVSSSISVSLVNESSLLLKVEVKGILYRPTVEQVDGGFKLSSFFKAWSKLVKKPVKEVSLEIVGISEGGKSVQIRLPKEGIPQPSYVSDVKVVWPILDFRGLENVIFVVKG